MSRKRSRPSGEAGAERAARRAAADPRRRWLGDRRRAVGVTAVLVAIFAVVIILAFTLR